LRGLCSSEPACFRCCSVEADTCGTYGTKEAPAVEDGELKELLDTLGFNVSGQRVVWFPALRILDPLARISGIYSIGTRPNPS